MRFEPRDEIQLSGIQFLVEHSYSALLWDPGRGKTITSLMATQILKDAGMVHRTLVTATKNIILDVWPDEIEKFDDIELTYAIVHGNERQRMAAMDLDADIYLTNYENVPWLVHTYGKNLDIDALIVDESSKFKNWQSQRFKNIRKVLSCFNRRTILTGTPIPKGYLGIYAQMYIVDMGESLGGSVTAYRNQYFVPSGYKGYNWILREGADKEIEKAIAPRVHRAERIHDGELHFYDLEVPLPEEAMILYRDIEREFIAEWQGKDIVAASSAISSQKLRQIANGAVYVGEGKKREFVEVHDKKIDALFELIAELQGAPLLLAYEYEHDIERIEAEAKKRGVKITRYGGEGEARKQLRKDWNEGKIQVLAGHLNSLSHGLNLQYGGCTAVLFGLTFDLDAFEQFYQRLWRDGQLNPVIIYLLIARDTVEHRMVDVLKERNMTQKKFLKVFAKEMGL